MKKTKKAFAIILTVIMAMTLFAAAFTSSAAGENHTITINQTETDHTYAAYQIFAGDLSGSTLSNIVWGSGVTTAGQTAMGNAAAKAATLTDESAAKAFANEVAQYLGSAAGTATYVEGQGYKITGLDAGYYLIMDTNPNLAEGEAMTKYILEVVKDVTTNPKGDGTPTVDKVIVEDGQDVDTNEVSIGDTVTYKITATIPAAAADYNKYFFIINDDLSEGLTFQPTSVAVTIGGQPAVAVTDYNLYTGEDAEGHTFQVALTDAKSHAGETVIVTYNAILNENAVIAGEGNPNDVDLTYSNNPNHNYEGTDKPNPGQPTGTTPKSTTVTYTTGIIIHKVDSEGNPLKGAAFRLTGDGVNIVMISSETFEEDAEGTYWKLKDGTYTTVDPETPDIDPDAYESTTIKYKKTIVYTAQESGTSHNVTATVGDDGELRFYGLGAGTYTISETVTPPTYNTIPDFTVTITFDRETKQFSATASGNNQVSMSDNIVTMDIVNNKGNDLPSTGGIGTTIFYVIGGILIAGAAVMFITRKRMGCER